LRIQYAHWPVWKPTAITTSVSVHQRKVSCNFFKRNCNLCYFQTSLNSHLPLSLPWTPTMHLCSSDVYFRCISFLPDNQTLKFGPTWISQGEKEAFAALLPVWKCIESTNPCCPPVQRLRFMHFRNLHHCLFKCRNDWLDCLTFRTFLSCCAVKIFQPKNPEIPAFQKPSSPLFSSTQNSTEISITYLPERFVNLHHKSPCCFSPNV